MKYKTIGPESDEGPRFFRDPDAFEALAHLVLPGLVEERPSDAPIRMWVPGCATGEEVYSLAIALAEVITARRPGTRFQIFGTDIREAAIEAARRGVYPASIARDVSAERLGRFFVRRGGRYEIAPEIRDACVFGRHDITRDPPFAHMDVVSCRNVLIHLDPAARQRVLAGFHFALAPAGHLFLGASETLDALPELFSGVDRGHGIYARNAAQRAGTFVPVPRASPLERSSRRAANAGDAARLAHETRWARLPANDEENEALVDVLEAANEELVSSNEALQSLGEELETSREALQTANDDLTAQNTLLRTRVSLLERLSGDLGELLAGAGVSIVEFTGSLHLRRFTPEAGHLLGLGTTAAGQPLALLDLGLDVPDLPELLAQAAGPLAAIHTRAVRDRRGRWYSMRIRSYHGAEGPAGVVMVLVELGSERPVGPT